MTFFRPFRPMIPLVLLPVAILLTVKSEVFGQPPIAEAPLAGSYDVVVVGGTPGGIMSALAAARSGHSALLLERSEHIGGLPANGLGATDIHTRGATAGYFLEFVGNIKRHYVEKYGADSPQVKACSDGYRFEPHVAEMIFQQMLNEEKERLTVLMRRQFNADGKDVHLKNGVLRRVRVINRETAKPETYQAKVFIDATYEGDLAAAAGAPFMIGREGQSEYNEPMAGRLYKPWGGDPAEGSTGLGDNAVQAYNFRLCLTDDPEIHAPIEKPESYNREEYASLVTDIEKNRFAAIGKRYEMEIDGIGRVTNMVRLPNRKTDANNQHAAFLSTDLPEENWPWPTSSWQWRDRYAKRLRDYTLGLLWFVQNDSELPEAFRERCRRWGLAETEYQDNDHFPRQVYVREGRRILGEHLFTAHDALPVQGNSRPPLYTDSITASHYALDSHAVRKREPGRPHLDGFFSYPTKPYTVPYGVMVPQKVEGLLAPVPVSGTHIGFSTLRMEPCWMALGQAAGTAAALAIEQGDLPRNLNVRLLQNRLLDDGAVLVYFRDAAPGDPHYVALQRAALRGAFPLDQWDARLGEPVDGQTARKWRQLRGAPPQPMGKNVTRGELLEKLFGSK